MNGLVGSNAHPVGSNAHPVGWDALLSRAKCASSTSVEKITVGLNAHLSRLKSGQARVITGHCGPCGRPKCSCFRQNTSENNNVLFKGRAKCARSRGFTHAWSGEMLQSGRKAAERRPMLRYWLPVNGRAKCSHRGKYCLRPVLAWFRDCLVGPNARRNGNTGSLVGPNARWSGGRALRVGPNARLPSGRRLSRSGEMLAAGRGDNAASPG